MRYYYKELPEAAVYIGGFPLKFEVLETADAHLIAELDKCVAKGVGGVMAMTKEQYEEAVKKKVAGTPLSPNSKPPQWRTELSAFHRGDRLAAAVAAGNVPTPAFAQSDRFERQTLPTSGRPMPDPIEVPSTEAFSGVFLKMPPTVKASEMKAVNAT